MNIQKLIQLRSAAVGVTVSVVLLFLELGTWVNLLAIVSLAFFIAVSVKILKTAN